MNVVQAIIHCLEYVDTVLEDNEYQSRDVYDCNGEKHWIAFSDNKSPRFCSESPTPFTKDLEPYDT